MKIAIIGTGNIGRSLAEGIVASGLCKAKDFILTRRNVASLEGMKMQGFAISADNLSATRAADVIFLCVLPQQLNACLAELKPVINPGKQLIVSVVTGAYTADISRVLGDKVRIVRAMPNTALRVRRSMTCLSFTNATQKDITLVQEIFNVMGTSIIIKEELMSAATALCACGTAFFLRAIRAASQGGVEIGFHAEEAIQIAAQTALGAASLLLESGGKHPESEIDKVTSPKGCTIAGLNEMEHNGFSSAMIKGIKLSAFMANDLYKPTNK